MPGSALRALALGALMTGTLACQDRRPEAAPEVATSLPASASSEPAGALARYDLGGSPTWRVQLPDELREISGLATAPDGRVFAHGDEDATIYQIDPRAGTITKRFTLAPTGNDPDLGKKAADGRLTGDFEGLAIAGDRFYLVTSTGVLLEFGEGEDGAAVPYTAHPTALEKTCEVEGVDHDPAGKGLVLLCKTMRQKSERQQVAAYTWSPAERSLSDGPSWAVPWSGLEQVTRGREFNGSGLALTPGGDSFALIAGPQQLFAEVTTDGRPVAGGALDKQAQPQPEGIAFLQDGTLLVSSEGGKGAASLSGYAAR